MPASVGQYCGVFHVHHKVSSRHRLLGDIAAAKSEPQDSLNLDFVWHHGCPATSCAFFHSQLQAAAESLGGFGKILGIHEILPSALPRFQQGAQRAAAAAHRPQVAEAGDRLAEPSPRRVARAPPHRPSLRAQRRAGRHQPQPLDAVDEEAHGALRARAGHRDSQQNAERIEESDAHVLSQPIIFGMPHQPCLSSPQQPGVGVPLRDALRHCLRSLGGSV